MTRTLLDKALDNRLMRTGKRAVVRALASWPPSCSYLNRHFDSLDDAGKVDYYDRYAKIFWNPGRRLGGGTWNLHFLDKVIKLPLRPAHSRHDWDVALSILAHDIEIKTSYRNLLLSDRRPEVFFDVGANYGTHSLLFASAGVSVTSFEPNPFCRGPFNDMAELNGLGVDWEPVAIGEEDGELELVFPPGETWLGSVVGTVSQDIRRNHADFLVERVQMRKLDDYAERARGKRTLIKIDVEGGEASVLKGASTLLRQSQPTIIFESNDRSKRAELAALLVEHGYAITRLPWSGKLAAHLSESEFRSDSGTNFLAKPRKGGGA